MRSSLRKELNRNEEPSACIIDSQSVKSTEMSRDIAGFDGGKNKGVKTHILTDTQGLLIKVICHKANIHNRIGAEEVLSVIDVDYPSIKSILADGGY